MFSIQSCRKKVLGSAQVNRSLVIAVTFASLTLAFSSALARDLESQSGLTPGIGAFQKPLVTRDPNFLVCVHKANNMYLAVTNFGCFGSLIGAYNDCETDDPAASCEFPAGTQQNYLWIGSLWIGAIVGPDTLVTAGHDGWRNSWELWPCAGPECGFTKMSNRATDLEYSEDAISDLDFIAEYTDTLVDHNWTGSDWQGREHIPLNIRVTQESYSWSAEYAQDFILIDYQIENMSDVDKEDVYMGIYVDAEAGHLSNYAICHLDDLCGYRETFPARVGHGFLDTIDLAWIADDDGDPGSGSEYDYASVTSVTGVKVMRTPVENLRVSFNWWISSSSPAFDWGPMMEQNRRSYGTGGQGTPEGDASKYYLLSNGEHDYDQIYARRSYLDEGWLPPNAAAQAVALGGDTRFVLSMGPFDLDAGETIPFTIGYVAGEKFHDSPNNFRNYMEAEYLPEEYYATLDFRDIAENSVWASWVYDNPGVDTDNDGDSGPFREIVDTLPGGTVVIDTFYYAGDGVPDFRSVSPPPPPVLRHSTKDREVTIRWNGLLTETAVDPFTRVADFEGYRVYMGRLPREDDLAMIVSHDRANFNRLAWIEADSSSTGFWESHDHPFTIGDLRSIYGDDFDPTLYPWNRHGDGYVVDSTTYCFDPIDWNQTIYGWDDGGEISEQTGFRKRFEDEIASGIVTSVIDTEDTLTSDNWIKDVDPLTGDSVYYHKYYEYEFTMENLLASVSWYFAVTAFDFGDEAFGIDPLETSPLANDIEVWAIDDASWVIDNRLEVLAYPNPYRGDGTYAASRYEDAGGSGFVDHERRMHFKNLPPRCTIKIYTISGDFVRELEHPGPYTQADSKLEWNMRSKNNELIASGIYLFVVKSEWGTQIGKLVVIL